MKCPTMLETWGSKKLKLITCYRREPFNNNPHQPFYSTPAAPPAKMPSWALSHRGAVLQAIEDQFGTMGLFVSAAAMALEPASQGDILDRAGQFALAMRWWSKISTGGRDTSGIAAQLLGDEGITSRLLLQMKAVVRTAPAYEEDPDGLQADVDQLDQKLWLSLRTLLGHGLLAQVSKDGKTTFGSPLIINPSAIIPLLFNNCVLGDILCSRWLSSSAPIGDSETLKRLVRAAVELRADSESIFDTSPGIAVEALLHDPSILTHASGAAAAESLQRCLASLPPHMRISGRTLHYERNTIIDIGDALFVDIRGAYLESVTGETSSSTSNSSTATRPQLADETRALLDRVPGLGSNLGSLFGAPQTVSTDTSQIAPRAGAGESHAASPMTAFRGDASVLHAQFKREGQRNKRNAAAAMLRLSSIPDPAARAPSAATIASATTPSGSYGGAPAAAGSYYGSSSLSRSTAAAAAAAAASGSSVWSSTTNSSASACAGSSDNYGRASSSSTAAAAASSGYLRGTSSSSTTAAAAASSGYFDGTGSSSSAAAAESTASSGNYGRASSSSTAAAAASSGYLRGTSSSSAAAADPYGGSSSSSTTDNSSTGAFSETISIEALSPDTRIILRDELRRLLQIRGVLSVTVAINHLTLLSAADGEDRRDLIDAAAAFTSIAGTDYNSNLHFTQRKVQDDRQVGARSYANAVRLITWLLRTTSITEDPVALADGVTGTPYGTLFVGAIAASQEQGTAVRRARHVLFFELAQHPCGVDTAHLTQLVHRETGYALTHAALVAMLGVSCTRRDTGIWQLNPAAVMSRIHTYAAALAAMDVAARRVITESGCAVSPSASASSSSSTAAPTAAAAVMVAEPGNKKGKPSPASVAKLVGPYISVPAFKPAAGVERRQGIFVPTIPLRDRQPAITTPPSDAAAQLPREPSATVQRSIEPCRYYGYRKCFRGDQCRFSHVDPIPASAPAVLSSPAVPASPERGRPHPYSSTDADRAIVEALFGDQLDLLLRVLREIVPPHACVSVASVSHILFFRDPQFEYVKRLRAGAGLSVPFSEALTTQGFNWDALSTLVARLLVYAIGAVDRRSVAVPEIVLMDGVPPLFVGANWTATPADDITFTRDVYAAVRALVAQPDGATMAEFKSAVGSAQPGRAEVLMATLGVYSGANKGFSHLYTFLPRTTSQVICEAEQHIWRVVERKHLEEAQADSLYSRRVVVDDSAADSESNRMDVEY